MTDNEQMHRDAAASLGSERGLAYLEALERIYATPLGDDATNEQLRGMNARRGLIATMRGHVRQGKEGN